MDVCIDPEFRGRRIGQRLYNERKKLCQHLRLKGVVFAGACRIWRGAEFVAPPKII